MVVLDLIKGRSLLLTLVMGIRAAGVERAALGRVNGGGHVPLQDNALLWLINVNRWYGG